MMAKKEEVKQEEVKSPMLDVSDLLTVVRIIDITASKGLFEGKDMEIVGGVRNRLEAFAKANLPQEK